MKKICYLIAVLFTVMALSSCDSCSNTDNGDNSTAITWNVNLDAAGEGILVVAYPTGNVTLNGNASIAAMSSTDTVAQNLLQSAPNYQTVLANPGNYDEETVKLAEEVKSAVYIDSMSGKWSVDIVGYAKYGQLVIVLDSHWPKEQADTTKVE